MVLLAMQVVDSGWGSPVHCWLRALERGESTARGLQGRPSRAALLSASNSGTPAGVSVAWTLWHSVRVWLLRVEQGWCTAGVSVVERGE